MKILLVATDSHMGGITTAATNFLNELYKRGHDVTFLDMSGENRNASSLLEGVKICELSGRARYWNIGSGDIKRAKGIKRIGLILLGAIKKITNRIGIWHNLILNKQKHLPEYDVVVAYRQCAPCYKFALKCVKAKTRLCFVHGELSYMGDISSWQKYMDKFYKVCYVSNAVKNQFVDRYPNLSNNATVIYNVIDNERVKTLSLEETDCCFEKDVLNLITISRIKNGSKGTERILEIAKELYNKGVKFCWRIVGDGPDLKECKKKIVENNLTENVVFLDEKANPFCYLSKSDALVSISKSEAFGMTILESLICGVPVIVGEYPALRELVSDKENAIISRNSAEELCKAIFEFATNKELRRKITEGSQNYSYCKENLMQRFEALVM